MAPRFATIWEFSGSWAQLFRNSPGYLGTDLWHDRADALRYVTIDRWASAEAWREFRAQFAAEYERLDREYAGLTTHEAPLGEFAPANIMAA